MSLLGDCFVQDGKELLCLFRVLFDKIGFLCWVEIQAIEFGGLEAWLALLNDELPVA